MFNQCDPFEKEVVMENLYEHVERLSVTIGERHLWKDVSLDQTADYIGAVGNFHSSRYVSFFKNGIGKYSNIDGRSLSAPEFFGGISLSDNYSFWRHHYGAIMVTDTSFFRNRHYHQETDTIDTLDFGKMTEVVKGRSYTLLELP